MIKADRIFYTTLCFFYHHHIFTGGARLRVAPSGGVQHVPPEPWQPDGYGSGWPSTTTLTQPATSAPPTLLSA